MGTIAIVGPGAIGGMLATWLCQDDSNKVTVCARTSLSSIEVNSPDGVIVGRPEVLTDVSLATPVDWVLVCVKTYQVEICSAWLDRLVGKETCVAVIQNGVEHVENLLPYVSKDRLLPVMIDCPSERISPEKIVQGAKGRIVVPVGDVGAAFEQLMKPTIFNTQQSPDFKTESWRKLCFNAAGAAMAITDVPARLVLHPEGREIMAQIARECVAVGRAEGADLDDSVVEKITDASNLRDPEAINSLHADRRAGRPMEIQARNGVIVERGKKHGIATPYNAMVVSLLKIAQEV